MQFHPIASHYTWWRGDALPALPPLAGFRASACADHALLARLHQLGQAEMAQRITEGSQPYVAWLGDTPVGYGWAAARAFGVADAGLHWTLQPGERGLWDFATLPEWRGRGVYPRLLQAIIAEESAAERFWIGHRADNPASQRGICRAGFQLIGITASDTDGAWCEITRGPAERSHTNPMAQGLTLTAADECDILAPMF